MIETVKKILGLGKKNTGIKLIVSCERLEKRVALLENNRLEEYTIERDTDRNIVGSIYKGRVRNIEQGLKAMFVDIGFEKNAFLHFWDAIPAALDSGVEDVSRDGRARRRDRRSPQRTSRASIRWAPKCSCRSPRARSAPRARASPPTSASPAAILVLMPFNDQCGISRKIEIPKERDRLRKILRELDIPEGMGVIMRTVGEGQRARYFVRDLRILVRAMGGHRARR